MEDAAGTRREMAEREGDLAAPPLRAAPRPVTICHVTDIFGREVLTEENIKVVKSLRCPGYFGLTAASVYEAIHGCHRF